MQEKDATHVIWRFLRPEVEELVAYALILGSMLGFALYQVAVKGSIGDDSQSLITSISGVKDTFLEFLSQNDQLGTYFLFGLWFLIGAVVYMLLWTLATILIDMQRDIRVSSSFVHPQSWHKSDYWLSVAGRATIRLAGAIALVVYGVIWGTSFAPVWITSFETLFAQGATAAHVTDALVAAVGVALTLHLASILLRVTLLRTRY